MNNYLEREEYWHWFHSLTGISQKEKEELLKVCPEVETWYMAGEKKEAEELFGPLCEEYGQQKNRRKQIVSVLEDISLKDNARKSYEAAKSKGIMMVCRASEEFPERLKHIFLPPLMLYYYGKLPKEDVPSLAVIGARNCSVYGK